MPIDRSGPLLDGPHPDPPETSTILFVLDSCSPRGRTPPPPRAPSATSRGRTRRARATYRRKPFFTAPSSLDPRRSPSARARPRVDGRAVTRGFFRGGFAPLRARHLPSPTTRTNDRADDDDARMKIKYIYARSRPPSRRPLPFRRSLAAAIPPARAPAHFFGPSSRDDFPFLFRRFSPYTVSMSPIDVSIDPPSRALEPPSIASRASCAWKRPVMTRPSSHPRGPRGDREKQPREIRSWIRTRRGSFGRFVVSCTVFCNVVCV